MDLTGFNIERRPIRWRLGRAWQSISDFFIHDLPYLFRAWR